MHDWIKWKQRSWMEEASEHHRLRLMAHIKKWQKRTEEKKFFSFAKPISFAINFHFPLISLTAAKNVLEDVKRSL